MLGLLATCVIAGGTWSRFGGFGTGPSADAGEFARYAAEVSAIEIPAGTRVVALGEATHGNREFQELKLDVLKVLVERYGVRAFALEADAGGCELVNRYIHGNEGTLEEAVADLDYTLYRTDQMAELVSWMRVYNETAAPGEDLRFYGFDMQNYEHSHQLLLEELRTCGLDTAGLESLGQLRDEHPDGLDRDLVVATYEGIRQKLTWSIASSRTMSWEGRPTPPRATGCGTTSWRRTCCGSSRRRSSAATRASSCPRTTATSSGREPTGPMPR